jgi:hypothetical protein
MMPPPLPAGRNHAALHCPHQVVYQVYQVYQVLAVLHVDLLHDPNECDVTCGC